jgi:hypothetical protein
LDGFNLPQDGGVLFKDSKLLQGASWRMCVGGQQCAGKAAGWSRCACLAGPLPLPPKSDLLILNLASYWPSSPYMRLQSPPPARGPCPSTPSLPPRGAGGQTILGALGPRPKPRPRFRATHSCKNLNGHKQIAHAPIAIPPSHPPALHSQLDPQLQGTTG